MRRHTTPPPHDTTKVYDPDGVVVKAKKSWGERLKLGPPQQYGTVSRSGGAMCQPVTWFYSTVNGRPSAPRPRLYQRDDVPVPMMAHPRGTIDVILNTPQMPGMHPSSYQTLELAPAEAVILCSCPELLSGTCGKSKKKSCKKCGGCRVVNGTVRGIGTLRNMPGPRQVRPSVVNMTYSGIPVSSCRPLMGQPSPAEQREFCAPRVSSSKVKHVKNHPQLTEAKFDPSTRDKESADQMLPSSNSKDPLNRPSTLKAATTIFDTKNSPKMNYTSVSPDPYDLMRRNRLGNVTPTDQSESGRKKRSNHGSPSPSQSDRFETLNYAQNSTWDEDEDVVASKFKTLELKDNRKSILECDVNAYELIAKYLKNRTCFDDEIGQLHSRNSEDCLSSDPLNDDIILEDELSDDLSDNALENSSEGEKQPYVTAPESGSHVENKKCASPSIQIAGQTIRLFNSCSDGNNGEFVHDDEEDDNEELVEEGSKGHLDNTPSLIPRPCRPPRRNKSSLSNKQCTDNVTHNVGNGGRNGQAISTCQVLTAIGNTESPPIKSILKKKSWPQGIADKRLTFIDTKSERVSDEVSGETDPSQHSSATGERKENFYWPTFEEFKLNNKQKKKQVQFKVDRTTNEPHNTDEPQSTQYSKANVDQTNRIPNSEEEKPTRRSYPQLDKVKSSESIQPVSNSIQENIRKSINLNQQPNKKVSYFNQNKTEPSITTQEDKLNRASYLDQEKSNRLLKPSNTHQSSTDKDEITQEETQAQLGVPRLNNTECSNPVNYSFKNSSKIVKCDDVILRSEKLEPLGGECSVATTENSTDNDDNKLSLTRAGTSEGSEFAATDPNLAATCVKLAAPAVGGVAVSSDMLEEVSGLASLARTMGFGVQLVGNSRQVEQQQVVRPKNPPPPPPPQRLPMVKKLMLDPNNFDLVAPSYHEEPPDNVVRMGLSVPIRKEHRYSDPGPATCRIHVENAPTRNSNPVIPSTVLKVRACQDSYEAGKTIVTVTSPESASDVHCLQVKNSASSNRRTSILINTDNQVAVKENDHGNGDDKNNKVTINVGVDTFHPNITTDSNVVSTNMGSVLVTVNTGTSPELRRASTTRLMSESYWTISDEEVLLFDPVEAVRRNLVPHVCGKRDISTISLAGDKDILYDNTEKLKEEDYYVISPVGSKQFSLIEPTIPSHFESVISNVNSPDNYAQPSPELNMVESSCKTTNSSGLINNSICNIPMEISSTKLQIDPENPPIMTTTNGTKMCHATEESLNHNIKAEIDALVNENTDSILITPSDCVAEICPDDIVEKDESCSTLVLPKVSSTEQTKDEESVGKSPINVLDSLLPDPSTCSSIIENLNEDMNTKEIPDISKSPSTVLLHESSLHFLNSIEDSVSFTNLTSDSEVKLVFAEQILHTEDYSNAEIVSNNASSDHQNCSMNVVAYCNNLEGSIAGSDVLTTDIGNISFFVDQNSENHYESIGDPIYEELPDTPPPLPLSPPPVMDLGICTGSNRQSRSIFEGATKYDIIRYLVGARDRGLVPTDTEVYYTSSSTGEPDDEETRDLSSQPCELSSRASHLSNASDSSEENCLLSGVVTASPLPDDDKIRKSSSEIERNDSGVGSETSKSSRSRWQHVSSCGQQQQQQHHLCEDCELPVVETQVTDSGVMFAPLVCRKCGRRRAERREIITEIAETEEKYGRDLQIVLEEFYQPMLVAGLLTSEQLSAIFLNVEELLEHSASLADKLRDSLDIALEQGDEDLLTVNIGKIFLEASPMLHAFETYCTKQGGASVLLSNLERDKELLRIFLRVSQMENSVLRRMNLNSFLMVPVQRVTKYPLLLARLYKVTPSHHQDRDQLRQAQEQIALHLDHINSVAKDISSTKLWRRISIMNGRRSNSESDMLDIKLRKAALSLLQWSPEESRVAMQGRLLVATSADTAWRRAKVVSAMLVAKPSENYRPEINTSELLFFPKKIGVQEAALVLFKEKCGKYLQLRKPLHLDKCFVCCETDWEDYFEVQELTTRETFMVKAEDGNGSKLWFRQLHNHAQGLGVWRRRRNALANIMINRN